METNHSSNEFKWDEVHQHAGCGYPVREVSEAFGRLIVFFVQVTEAFNEAVHEGPKGGHVAESRRM